MKFLSLLLLPLAIPACTAGKVPEQENTEYALIRIELDRSKLRNRGQLPVFTRDGGENFGMQPRAVGALRFTDIGRAVCRVQFIDPLLGVSGEPSYHRYQVLSFYGIPDGSGERLVLEDDAGSDYALGVATVLHMERDRDELRIQPATRERRLPYVFHFKKAPTRSRPVSIPTIN